MTDNEKKWELITSKVNNELSESEAEELDSLMVNEDCKTLFHEIHSIKCDLDNVQKLKNFSQNRSWGKVNNHIHKRYYLLGINILKYAAIIVIAFFIGKFIPDRKINIPNGTTEISVPLGQMSEVTLKDGSKIWLNSGTSLKYDESFGINDRNIFLEGEAFFKVAKNETPFKVRLKNAEVEVLGTSFNIVSYNDESSSHVVLVEGKLNVNNLLGIKIAQLEPSYQIYIDDISHTIKREKVDTEFYTSWTEGKIIFNDEKLSDISGRLERWYNVDIQFGDDSVGDFKFSGTILKHKPFNQIVTTFELLLPIRIKYTVIPNGKDLIVITKE
jgi:ferric-dicitrate binding protein FerR (iron transport regulator)